MQSVSSFLNKPIGQKQARVVFTALVILLFAYYGHLFVTRRPPVSTALGAVLPGRAGVPVFDSMIYGEFGDGQFDKPMAVTTAHGRIYISDTNNSRVQVFDNAGRFLFTFGENGKAPGQFLYPYGIAGDRNGNIYVAELYLGRIQVYDTDGNYLHDFASELTAAGIIQGPGDMVIVDRTMYVTDINRNKVLLIDLESGELIRQVGMPNDLLAPNGVAVDEAGYIFVVDTGRQRVVVYDTHGNPVRVINGTPNGHGRGSVLINPRGIGLDRSGHIFVVSNMSHSVFVFNREGEVVRSFGGQGDGNNEFMFPHFIIQTQWAAPWRPLTALKSSINSSVLTMALLTLTLKHRRTKIISSIPTCLNVSRDRTPYGLTGPFSWPASG
jgi:DNA-binding beta-propeller fold protein YncE